MGRFSYPRCRAVDSVINSRMSDMRRDESFIAIDSEKIR